MDKALTRTVLKKLASTGERLYGEIKKTKKLPAGEFIAINCEPESRSYGEYVCGKFDSVAADRFLKKFGNDMMWVRQIDFSLAQRKVNQRWPIGKM